MKIGDIKPGTEYALSRKRRYSHGNLPRKATALAIETVEETYWQGEWSRTQATRKVRRVRIRVEGEPTSTSSWDEKFETADEGAELLIEARHIDAPWSAVRGDVQKRIDREATQDAAEEATLARINALLPKKLQDDYFNISAYADGKKLKRVEATLEGDVLETILALAEKGQAA
jgi:hypothetical protein